MRIMVPSPRKSVTPPVLLNGILAVRGGFAGIQFEISTGSFENIVLEGSIVKGEILGKCIWTSNKNLQLVL
jgi:hypothetical protein